MRNPSSSGDHIPQSSSDVFVRLPLRQTTAALSLLPKLGNIMDHGAVNDCPGLRIQTLLSRTLELQILAASGNESANGVRTIPRIRNSPEVESGRVG